MLGIASISAACATTPSTPRALPTRPTLHVQINPDSPGGVCFDRADAAALGAYIQALENRERP